MQSSLHCSWYLIEAVKQMCVLIRNFSKTNRISNWQQLCADKHVMNVFQVARLFSFFPPHLIHLCQHLFFCPCWCVDSHCVSNMGLGSGTFSLAVCVPTTKHLLGSQLQEINKIHWAALFLVSVVCPTTCDFWMMDLQNKMVSCLSVERRLAEIEENTTWTLLTDVPFA